jgi:hypothetical protein
VEHSSDHDRHAEQRFTSDSDTWPDQIHSRRRDDSEMSSELAAPIRPTARDHSRADVLRENAIQETKAAGRAAGWAALILALLSWIVWPVLLGASAVVVGFVAFVQGSRGLGIWSMTLGLIAVAAYLVLIPFYYAVT